MKSTIISTLTLYSPAIKGPSKNKVPFWASDDGGTVRSLNARGSIQGRYCDRGYQGAAGFALALTGIRRSGKTFLALDVASRLSKQLLYFNFEDPIFVQDNDVGNLDTIVSLYTEYLGHEPGVIIFDEIQNIAGWGLACRRLVVISMGST